MANGLPISKDQFHHLDSADAKLDALFDYLVYMTTEKCEKRFQAIEKRKWADRGMSGGAGLIGGFFASLFKG